MVSLGKVEIKDAFVFTAIASLLGFFGLLFVEGPLGQFGFIAITQVQILQFAGIMFIIYIAFWNIRPFGVSSKFMKDRNFRDLFDGATIGLSAFLFVILLESLRIPLGISDISVQTFVLLGAVSNWILFLALRKGFLR